MIPVLLSKLADIVEGKLVGADATIESVSTDTRNINSGDLFIALKGPNFDGNKFLAEAREDGAVAAIVSEQQPVDMAQIVVEDTRVALGLMGAYVKAQVAPKTLAITGSSGKTTVKEMIAAILRLKGNVLATRGNFNNEIGVPLTLLRLEPQHDYAVIELGANHQGEIAYTVSLVQPHIAMVNNVAAAHLEGFGDLTGVARAKGEIFSGLAQGGIALYNQSIEFSHLWERRLANKHTITFSCEDQGEYHCKNVSFDDHGCGRFTLVTPVGESDIALTVPGRHNVCNAVAAAAMTMQMGASLSEIKSGLMAMGEVNGRMNLQMLGDKVRMIDDTYNANVQSTRAAIELLSEYEGKKVMVLGDMAELGRKARCYHEEVGQFAKDNGIDRLFTLGVLSQSASEVFNGQGQHFSSRERLVAALLAYLEQQQQPTTVIVKGSRSARMELVVQAVKAQITDTGEAEC